MILDILTVLPLVLQFLKYQCQMVQSVFLKVDPGRIERLFAGSPTVIKK
jgi:hypothetical protein